MSDKFVVTYKGIEITHGTKHSYKGEADTWTFVLRGRTRTVDSLVAAKIAIDKVPAEKKTQTFKQFDAFVVDAYGSIGKAPVTVTSFAGYSICGSGKNGQFWTVSKEKVRSRINLDELVPVNVDNTAKIQAILALKADADELDKKALALAAALPRMIIPTDIDSDKD